MLEQWLETLEGKEKELLQKVQELTLSDRMRDLAQKEIKVNAQSIRYYLKQLDEKGYPLQDDLCEVREIYERNDSDYRAFINGIYNHLFRMGKVIQYLKEGQFEAEFGLYF